MSFRCFWTSAVNVVIWFSNAAIASDVDEETACGLRMVTSSSLSVPAPAFSVVSLDSEIAMGHVPSSRMLYSALALVTFPILSFVALDRISTALATVPLSLSESSVLSSPSTRIVDAISSLLCVSSIVTSASFNWRAAAPDIKFVFAIYCSAVGYIIR